MVFIQKTVKLFIVTLLILVHFMTQNSHASGTFLVKDLSEKDIAEMLKSKVLKKPYFCDPSRLKILTISYYDFSGKTHDDGKIVVLDAAAQNVIKIFQEIYENKFPLQSVKLMDDFGGDDDFAMNENNSSAFNQRRIAGSDKLSIHSYGLAIDINPLQNPFIIFNHQDGSAQYHPSAGVKFINRPTIDSGESKKDAKKSGFVEPIVKIFHKNGLTIWGGDWKDPIDYHHFQTSRALAELLVKMDAKDAEIFFKAHVKFLNKENKGDEELVQYAEKTLGEDLIFVYLADKIKFIDWVNNVEFE